MPLGRASRYHGGQTATMGSIYGSRPGRGGRGRNGQRMTSLETPTTASPAQPHAQAKITVEDPQVMVRLLGAADEILKLVERSLASDIMVRGNQITITGAPADNALAEQVFAELIELIQRGETLTV